MDPSLSENARLMDALHAIVSGFGRLVASRDRRVDAGRRDDAVCRVALRPQQHCTQVSKDTPTSSRALTTIN